MLFLAISMGTIAIGTIATWCCDFAALSGCTQLVHGSTHRAVGILDLVMSDVPDLCKVQVGCPIGRSDHSHIGAVLDLSLGAPCFDFGQVVVLKSTVNWRAVRLDVAQMLWGVIVRSSVMVDVLDAELSRIIEVGVTSVKVRRRSGDEP